MRKISLYYITISMVISTVGYFTRNEANVAMLMLMASAVWSFLGLVLIVLEVRGIFALLRGDGSNVLEPAQSNPHPYREPAPNIEPTELDGASDEERKTEAALYLITMDLGRPVDNRERIRPRTPDINAPAPKPISE